MKDIDIAKNMKIDDNKIEINLENIEPDEKDRIIISTRSLMFNLSIGMSLPDDFVYSREIIILLLPHPSKKPKNSKLDP
jgi:hypothetical protein